MRGLIGGVNKPHRYLKSAFEYVSIDFEWLSTKKTGIEASRISVVFPFSNCVTDKGGFQQARTIRGTTKASETIMA